MKCQTKQAEISKKKKNICQLRKKNRIYFWYKKKLHTLNLNFTFSVQFSFIKGNISGFIISQNTVRNNNSVLSGKHSSSGSNIIASGFLNCRIIEELWRISMIIVYCALLTSKKLIPTNYVCLNNNLIEDHYASLYCKQLDFNLKTNCVIWALNCFFSGWEVK